MILSLLVYCMQTLEPFYLLMWEVSDLKKFVSKLNGPETVSLQCMC